MSAASTAISRIAGALSLAFFHYRGWPCAGVLACWRAGVCGGGGGEHQRRAVDSKESRLGCGHVNTFLRLVKVTARVLLGVKEIYACHF